MLARLAILIIAALLLVTAPGLARSYAERMASEEFFGHVDPQGRDPQMRFSEARIPGPAYIGAILAESLRGC
jgi:uncharacterized protein YkwD